jgi:hypothetical protein
MITEKQAYTLEDLLVHFDGLLNAVKEEDGTPNQQIIDTYVHLTVAAKDEAIKAIGERQVTTLLERYVQGT